MLEAGIPPRAAGVTWASTPSPTEARHACYLNLLDGDIPFANAFDVPEGALGHLGRGRQLHHGLQQQRLTHISARRGARLRGERPRGCAVSGALAWRQTPRPQAACGS